MLAVAALLGAPVEHEVAAAFPHQCAGLDAALIKPALDVLDDRCRALMADEGLTAADVEISHAADLCCMGQPCWLEVPIELATADPVVAAYDAFLAAHDRVYGHAPPMPAKFVNLRAVHRSRTGRAAGGVGHGTAAAMAPATRLVQVRQNAGPVPAAVWQRGAIGPADRIPGPAIIARVDTATLAEPGWTARLGEGGALIIEKDPA